MNIQVEFGALAPRIEEQLQSQGMRLDMEPLLRQHLQRDADEVSRLRIRGVLSESESDRARARIMKDIKRQVRKIDA